MQICLTASEHIDTRIGLPSSKSISNRVLVINALSGNRFTPANLSDCDDTRVMVNALTRPQEEVVDILAAGTAMRFLTAYYASTPGVSKQMTGTKRMQQRPIRLLVDALQALGADIAYLAQEGFPPLRIRGKELYGTEVSLPGNVSSQYISALLMIGPVLKNGLVLHLEGNVISRPYIDLTLQLMRDFGAEAMWVGEHEIHISPRPYRSIPFVVESDWSAASYWYQIVALTKDNSARVVLPGLYADSYQGDSAVCHLFEQLGVSSEYDDGSRSVLLRKNGKQVERMEYDFVCQPDLAQTFVVTCALMGVPFRFSGLQSLKIKETDRIAALICELKKLGFLLVEEEDGVLGWNGACCKAASSPVIDTYEDHRMAMAFAPACLVMEGVRINNPQVVTKSYPDFWNHLIQAGFGVAYTSEEIAGDREQID